jgi:hypothetical protein
MGDTKVRPGLIYLAVVVMAIAVGVALRWSALDAALLSDDYAQYAMLKGSYPVERSIFDLYTFVGGRHETKALKDFGVVPWWGHPDLRLSMMRPLSSVMVILDYVVFGKNVYGFHIHSMLWWMFLVASVAVLLRELLPTYMAAIAIILFALEEGHEMLIAWLANRSALIALSFGLLGLWAHIRWRRRGHKLAFVMSITMFILALLAGEWAFPVFAYLLAFEVFGVSDSKAKRIKALLPVAFLAIAFIVAQRLLNYSPVASDVYVNPFSEPTIFLKESLFRIPAFFAELVFGIPVGWYDDTPWRSVVLSLDIFSPSVWRMLPSWKFWHSLIGVFSAVVLFYAIRWGLKDQSRRVSRELLWLLIGALVSLIPMVASFPSSRLVVPAFIGISVCYAMIIQRCYRVLRAASLRDVIHSRTVEIAIVIALGMAYYQVWEATLESRYDMIRRNYLHNSIREWVLYSDIDDEKVANQDIFMINGVEHTSAVYSPYIRYFYGLPLPRSCRILSGAPHAHDITRTAPNELEILVLGGTFLNGGLAELYRADRFRYRLNDGIYLKGLTIRILALDNGRPYRARFIFDKPLEDPSYLFLHSTKNGLRRFELPAVGATVRLPLAQFPSWWQLHRDDVESLPPMTPVRKDGYRRSVAIKLIKSHF